MLGTAAEIFLDVLCLAMHPKTNGTIRLLIAVIELYETHKLKDDFFHDPIVKICASIISDIINEDLDVENTADYNVLLIKLENYVKLNSPELLVKIKTIFETKDNIANSRITNLQKKIRSWVSYYRGTKLIGNMYFNSNKCNQTTNQLKREMYLNNILSAARDIVKDYETPDITNEDIIDMIDMSSKESIKKAFNANKSKTRGGKIKTGLQGLNKSFGSRGAVLRGEFMLFAGLSHHYKSGMLMDMARWIATLNKPGNCLGKIPTIVFISLENEIHENMMQWYRDAYKNFAHDDDSDKTDDQIIDYIHAIFGRNGFRVLVIREMGETFGYDDWAKLHIKLQNSGYHIVASITDYISKMKLEEGGVNDAKKRENLTGKMANFCNHNGILGVSAIQLNGLAEEIAASGKNNIVKRYNGGHIADAKGFKKEADILIFLHIENNPMTGRKYLTGMLRKHRYVNDTTEEDKYWAYEFVDKYGILDDIKGQSKCVKDIYLDDGNNNPKDDPRNSPLVTLY